MTLLALELVAAGSAVSGVLPGIRSRAESIPFGYRTDRSAAGPIHERWRPVRSPLASVRTGGGLTLAVGPRAQSAAVRLRVAAGRARSRSPRGAQQAAVLRRARRATGDGDLAESLAAAVAALPRPRRRRSTAGARHAQARSLTSLHSLLAAVASRQFPFSTANLLTFTAVAEPF